LVTIQGGSLSSPVQGCVEQIQFTDCYGVLRTSGSTDFGYTTNYFPQTRFTVCSCTPPQFITQLGCEDAACAILISNDCIGRICFTWEVVVPPLSTIEQMRYYPCDQSGSAIYPQILYVGTYFICSLTIPIILKSSGTIPYVNTNPLLDEICNDPVPQIPTSVGTCTTWGFVNNLNVGESVTFIYTNCDRNNYVIQVDSTWTTFEFCSLYGPIFISGSPNNDVYSRLLVLQTSLESCGCYYGCASGFECIQIAYPVSAISPGVIEQWELPLCGGNDYPTLTTIELDSNSGNCNIIGLGLCYSACTANPFEWWAFYTEQFQYNLCANFTTTYPTNIPQALDTIPFGFSISNNWYSITGLITPLFDIPSTYTNTLQELGSSCGCNNIGFASESCVVLRDCCSGNIVYTGTIMNNNYSWVVNNYTVSNLGLTDCCLYLDAFVQPLVINNIDQGQILKNYEYPDNNGFITSYETTGCNVCLNPTPTPTMTQTNTPTPSPTPFPIYSWYWINNSNPSATYFGTNNTSSCFLTRIFIDRFNSNDINVSSILNSLTINDVLEIQSGVKSRQYFITQISIAGSDNYVFDINPLQGTCSSLRNFTFTNNTLYNIKFFKR